MLSASIASIARALLMPLTSVAPVSPVQAQNKVAHPAFLTSQGEHHSNMEQAVLRIPHIREISLSPAPIK